MLSYQFGDEPKTEAELRAEGFTCMVEFDDGIVQSEKAQLLHLDPPSGRIKRWIQRDLSEAIERAKVLERPDLNYAEYLSLKTNVSLVSMDLATGESKGAGQGGLGFAFSVFMLTFVMVYGMHVMRGVIEEKSNRIVEVVISSVRPAELLAGKVIGIGLVGLTQFLLFTTLGYATTLLGGWALESAGLLQLPDATENPDIAAITPDLSTWIASNAELSFLLDVNWGLMIGATVLFYAAGFALFASMFAAVGSMVEQESDAQYLMLPVMVPLLASYMMAAFAIQDPEGIIALVGSWIPFTAPVLMLVRLPLGVPWWEVLLSWAGVVATAWGIIALAGRIYHTGILMYGKRPTLKEIWRWVRIS